MFFRHKNEINVDLGDLQNEQVNLSNFLLDHFKVHSSESYKSLKLNAEEVSLTVLVQMVNKFVSRRNLSSTHWVVLEKNSVKIKRFEQTRKSKENKHPTQPSIITHGW